MKPFVIAILAFSLSACLHRGILTDEYTSWEEARRALETEIEYRFEEADERIERIREDFAEFYVKIKAAHVLLDEDSLRDWLEDRLRTDLGL
jgi:hypothetical protein